MHEIANYLKNDQYAAWSYNGAKALAEYLDDMDEDMELDIVDIRCTYSEYDNAVEAASSYSWDKDTDQDEEEQEANALEYLQDHTQVIQFDGGIIIQQF